MKKFLAAVSATALALSVSTSAFAGGLNDVIVDPVVEKKGPASSFPVWILIPVVACLVMCGQGNDGPTDTEVETN